LGALNDALWTVFGLRGVWNVFSGLSSVLFGSPRFSSVFSFSGVFCAGIGHTQY
jgi:hypothetical protein